jgi:hypothetical protein
VVVAVIAVTVMQVTAHEVIHVVAMRHRLVAAALAVHMPALVPHAVVTTRAMVRILGPDLDRAVVNVIVVDVVKVPAVQVIDVIAVADGGMPAAFAVDVTVIGMVRMGSVAAHPIAPLVIVVRGVIEGSLEQVPHVLILEAVVDMAPGAASPHEALAPEHPEPVRDRRDVGVERRGELTHAGVAPRQQREHMQPPLLAHCPEKRRGPRHDVRVGRRELTRMVLDLTFGYRLSIAHLNYRAIEQGLPALSSEFQP